MACAGVIKVVVKQNFVGVVCEKPWQAMQAARTLKASWTRGSGAAAGIATFYDFMRQQPARNTLVVDSGDVDRALGQAATRRAGHLPASVPDARVDGHVVRRGRCLAAAAPRSGRRRSRPTRFAQHRGDDPRPAGRSSVRVIFTRGSGCYGINGADTVSYDAAVLSQAVGRPVRVQLSRQDEMAWENYGFAYVDRSARGSRSRRHHRRVGLRVVERRARRTARLRDARQRRHRHAAGLLAGAVLRRERRRRRRPASTTAATPRPPTSPAARAACGGTGVVKSERVLTHTIRSPFFTGPLRSPSRLQNTFAHESFMDELAARVKADPVEYRLRHLRDPRLIDVVKAAAKARGVGHAAVAATGPSGDWASPAAAASPACSTRATTATARWWPRSRSIRPAASIRVTRMVGVAGLRADLLARRDEEPDRGRRAAGPEPRARRSGHLGRHAR